MAIRSKGWTALLSVKIVCFILICALAAAFVCGAYMLIGKSYYERFNLDMLFIDFSEGNRYFFDEYANSVWDISQTLLYYQSEERIKNKDFLMWVDMADTDEDQTRYLLRSPRGGRDWGYLPSFAIASESAFSAGETSVVFETASEFDDTAYRETLKRPEELRDEMENAAIADQLYEFREAKRRLEEYDGLLYTFSNSEASFSNVENYTDEMFKSNPVYWIMEDGRTTDVSNRYQYGAYGGQSGYQFNIAFTESAVSAQNNLWKLSQRTYLVQAAMLIGEMLLAFVLFVVLLCGAGRRHADNGEAIHFTLFDKTYLDIGLVLIIIFELFFVSILTNSVSNMFVMTGRIFEIGNHRQNLTMLAVITLIFFPPALAYLLSLAKRIKAGKWWHYTFLWKVCDKLRGFLKSLWAGVPLTLQVIVAGVSMFAVVCIPLLNIIGEAALWVLAVFAVAVVLMLRYARKIYKLERGATAASLGVYDMIDVKGGKLGSIADSINNISAGINAAVEQRLRSERLKTELITNVSHDIRTPLTSMITYADLLKNEGLTSEKAPGYLDILIQKSQRLKTLTDELFEAAKAATGNVEANLTNLDLADLIRQVLGELDERVKSSELDFRLNLSEHAWVMADGKLMWRVMENLLSNVFKYAQKQSRVYLNVVQSSGEVRFEIKNVSAEPLNVDPAELTERFKRGDESRSGEGSGLGLSIVQSFVEAQNGSFTISIDGDLFKATITLTAGIPVLTAITDVQ